MSDHPCPKCQGTGWHNETWTRPDCTDPATDVSMLVECECGIAKAFQAEQERWDARWERDE